MLVLVAVATFHGQTQQLATFKISGRVVRHADHRPVHEARVTITMVDKTDRHLSAVTGENGEFLFYGLPAAKYSLQVDNHGWSQSYEQLEGYSTAIVTGTGFDTEHIVFLLDTPAAITGAVVDEDGDPVRQASVFLFSGGMSDGKSSSGMQATNTDADGRFHFKNLRDCVYYVAAFGRPWYAQNPVQFVAGDQLTITETKPELDVAFPLTYYGGGVTPEAAAPVKLAAGMKAEIQITLRAVPALPVTFDGVEKQADQQVQISVTQIGPGGTPIQLPLFGNNGFLSGVPPGDYRFSGSLSGPNGLATLGSQTVKVASNSTVHLNESARTSVRGKVVIDGSDLPEGLAILLRSANITDQQVATVAKDGHFEFPQASEGRSELRLANFPDVYISKVTADGGVYAKGELTIPRGAQVNLVIQVAKGVSKVSGIVVTRDKKAVAGAMVLLIPKNVSYCNFIPRDQSDSDGTFTMGWVTPGRYTLVAIEDGRGLAYADEAVIKPYLPGGKELDVPVPKEAQVEVEVQPRIRER